MRDDEAGGCCPLCLLKLAVRPVGSTAGSSPDIEASAADGSGLVDKPSHIGPYRVPKPAAVAMAYTAHTDYASGELSTFVVVGEEDGIAPPAIMERRVEALRKAGTNVEHRKYRNVGHGFGLGTGTSAEGWIFDDVRFWETSMRRQSSKAAVTLKSNRGARFGLTMAPQ